MRVLVLADTHMRADWDRSLPPRAWDRLADADVILHAGDVIEGWVLDELAELAPVHAVLGNNDRALVGSLPETLELELAGVRIGMIHDSGPAAGRDARLHARFPDRDVVVFGHSHIPWNAPGLDGQLLFNPGSPTERRRQPHRTVGVLELRAGRVLSAQVEVVDAQPSK
ncbi:MAG: metallophosphatase family protein [Actinobacteria bacterium]|nr:metallophosphatase family protein [Actinomycetota bacterium]